MEGRYTREATGVTKLTVSSTISYQLFGVGALAHRGLPPFTGGLCGDHSPHRTTMTQRKCCPILHFGLWWLHLPVSTRAASFTVTQTTLCATARVRDRSLGDQLPTDNNDLSDISESKSSLIAHRTLVEFRPMPSPTGDELWEHFVGEFMMTFLLVFSGLETAVNSENGIVVRKTSCETMGP